MYCTECGNKLSDNAKFCSKCGIQVDPTSASKQITQEIKANPNLAHLQSPEQKQTVNKQVSVHVGQVSHETEKEPIALPFYKDNVKMLKTLSLISIITFFLPVGSGFSMFYTSLSSREPSVVTVSLFMLLLTLCIVIFFKLYSNKTTYKMGMIISLINILLSLNLVLPTPYNTQNLCVGSILILLVSVLIFVYGKNALRSVKETETNINYNITTYTEKENEISRWISRHKLTLKVIALAGMVIFFLPCVVTSCGNTDTRETGFDIMTHFSNGVGNMYAITIFALFLLVFISLFNHSKASTAFAFIFGSVNVILLAISKSVFGVYIAKYLIGFYLCFIAALALSIGGFILYRKVRKAWGDYYFITLKNGTKSIVKATLVIIATLIIIVVINNKINKGPISVTNNESKSSNSSSARPAETAPSFSPTPKYTFDEVVTTQAKHLVDGGRDFQVKSEEANYYGEIEVGQRSYVEGMSEIKDTYALFVTDGPNTTIKFTFNLQGYYKTHALKGAANYDNIIYPADASFLAAGMEKYTMSFTGKDGATFEHINGLSLVEAYFSQNEDLFGSTFKMLCVVISKDEAVRYAEDGTLPKCLQGLTVTGLDNIFKAPIQTGNPTTASIDTLDIPDAPESDFSYLYDATNTVQITGYLGKDTSVRIPNTIDGKPVKNIRQYAFVFHEELEVVIIPEGVITIDDHAFAGCKNLTSITIPSSVTYIGEYAFANCTKLNDSSKRSILSIDPQMDLD